MHISEGVLSAPVLAAGGSLTVAGVGYALRKMDYDRVPQVAIMSCAFFVASLIHVPIGPVSAHLVLNGLMGIVLGWAAFPAIMVALFLQGVLFQFGGLTTLGVNTLNMALPAVACYLIFGPFVRARNALLAGIAAFLCGALAVSMAGLMVAASLVFTGESFVGAAKIVVAAHVPVMLVEGAITTLVVMFLKRVKPQLVEAPHVVQHVSDR
jgi:cobalt/nickel transport system permease protein